ncbi:MAG TPA: hypothetical protein VKB19_12730 [Pedobacter sp.]|nr:hypothetical protein [Pedobacter sp.]
MSLLDAVINKVEDGVLREQLQERVDIVLHKIKFMEKIPVSCLDTENASGRELQDLIVTAGGELQADPLNARVVIYCEKEVGILQLMGAVPALLHKDWPAVTYSRVYLWEDFREPSAQAQSAVDALEDLAEMLYPGYFVFGNEGKTWISFKTQ